MNTEGCGHQGALDLFRETVACFRAGYGKRLWTVR